MRKCVSFVTVVLALWIGCGRVARGYWIGKFTTRYPDQEHERGAVVNYAFGPFALVGEALVGDFSYPYMPHGRSCQQRYEYFKSTAPQLDKNYFIHFGGNELCNADDLK